MPGRQVYSVGGQGQSTITDPCITAARNPASTDVTSPNGYPYSIGQTWQNTSTGNIYIYLGAGNWEVAEATTGDIITMSDTSTTSVTPDSNGNVQLSGTNNQVNMTAGSHKITASIPATFIGPGSVASTTTMTAGTGITSTTGAITATNGNLAMGTAGNKIIVPTGANASAGTSAAMTGTPGAVIVATTACSATAKVFYCRNVTGGTMGNVSITAQDGTGFTLTSDANETSTFNWWIINN